MWLKQQLPAAMSKACSCFIGSSIQNGLYLKISQSELAFVVCCLGCDGVVGVDGNSGVSLSSVAVL